MLSAAEALRFWSKVEITETCWSWTACLMKGYGQVRLRRLGGLFLAHRVAYTHLTGAIPEGLQLDHLCRNRACVRPSHLEPVTNRENVLRGEGPAGKNARKTHCPRGHALAGHNCMVELAGRSRKCRACHNARVNARNRTYFECYGRWPVAPCRRRT